MIAPPRHPPALRGDRRHDPKDVQTIARSVARYEPTHAPASGAPLARNASEIVWLGAKDIFKPLAEISWCVEALKITAGAPTSIGGSSFGGKTVFAQNLLTAKALGVPLFGRHAMMRGRCGHADGEQGRRVTFEKYQRLTRGYGAEPHDLEGHLFVTVFPDVRLDSPHALDVYSRAVDGLSVCLIDSLKAFMPSTDENAGEIRRALDLAGAISETTGCTFIFLDHLRKATQHDSRLPAGERLRGHSSKKDALQSLILLSGETGGTKHVEQDKERVTGVPFAPFDFEIQDIERDGDPRWGLRLAVPSEEEIAHRRAIALASAEAAKGNRDDSLRQWIIEVCAARETTGKDALTSANKIVGALRSSGKKFREADALAMLKQMRGPGGGLEHAEGDPKQGLVWAPEWQP